MILRLGSVSVDFQLRIKELATFQFSPKCFSALVVNGDNAWFRIVLEEDISKIWRAVVIGFETDFNDFIPLIGLFPLLACVRGVGHMKLLRVEFNRNPRVICLFHTHSHPRRCSQIFISTLSSE